MSTYHDEVFWQGHLNRIAAQGIGTKAYAQREGLAVSSLYYWRTRLNKQSAQRTVRVADHRGGDLFVPLTVSDHKNTQADICVLSVGPNLRLELSNLPSPQWLAQVSQAFVRQEA